MNKITEIEKYRENISNALSCVILSKIARDTGLHIITVQNAKKQKEVKLKSLKVIEEWLHENNIGGF